MHDGFIQASADKLQASSISRNSRWQRTNKSRRSNGSIGPSRLCGPMLPVLIPPPRTQPSSYTSRMSPRQAYYHTTQYTSSQPDNCQPVPASSTDTQTGCTQTINCPGHSGRQPRSPLPGEPREPRPRPQAQNKNPRGPAAAGGCHHRCSTCSQPNVVSSRMIGLGTIPSISSRPFPHAACDPHLVQI